MQRFYKHSFLFHFGISATLSLTIITELYRDVFFSYPILSTVLKLAFVSGGGIIILGFIGLFGEDPPKSDYIKQLAESVGYNPTYRKFRPIEWHLFIVQIYKFFFITTLAVTVFTLYSYSILYPYLIIYLALKVVGLNLYISKGQTFEQTAKLPIEIQEFLISVEEKVAKSIKERPVSFSFEGNTFSSQPNLVFPNTVILPNNYKKICYFTSTRPKEV